MALPAEAIRGGDDALAHAGIARAMPRLADDDSWLPGQCCRAAGRTSGVPSSNRPWIKTPGMPADVRVAQQRAVFEPGIVAPMIVTTAQTPAGRWSLVADQARRRMQRDEGDLPIAPVPRRLLMDRGIGIHQKAVIGIDQTAGPIRFGNAIAKTGPGLREVDTDATGYRLDLPAVVVADADSTISLTWSGCCSAKASTRVESRTARQPPRDA